MGSGGVLFVHGAGNRTGQASAYGHKLRAGLGVPAGRFRFSDWGAATGPDATLPRLASALPAAVRAFAPPAEALPADPYAPLKALAGGPAAAFGQGDKSEVASVLACLQVGGLGLDDVGLPSEQLAAATAEVLASPELAAARGDPVALIDAAVTSAVARAVQRQAQPAGAFGFDILGAAKDALATVAMGNGALSVVGAWLGPMLSGAAALWVSRRLATRRQSIMQDHILVAADVLYYQRHGNAIRDHVRAEIASLKAPRLALGHSLGGIILVDALFGPGVGKPAVDLLVTFGSQAAFLGAIGALDVVIPDAPWLNIWTRYDFVSFIAGGIWPDVPSVTDVEIPIEVGFPESHGAYYDASAFYDAIRSHPRAAAILA